MCHETKREEERTWARMPARDRNASADNLACALVGKADSKGDDWGGTSRTLRVRSYGIGRVCHVLIQRDTDAAKKDAMGRLDCNRLSLPLVALQFVVLRHRIRACCDDCILRNRWRLDWQFSRCDKTS